MFSLVIFSVQLLYIDLLNEIKIQTRKETWLLEELSEKLHIESLTEILVVEDMLRCSVNGSHPVITTFLESKYFSIQRQAVELNGSCMVCLCGIIWELMSKN
jgi:hypothetical protein